MSGKGSTRRPQQVSEQELERRWAETFADREPDETESRLLFLQRLERTE